LMPRLLWLMLVGSVLGGALAAGTAAGPPLRMEVSELGARRSAHAEGDPILLAYKFINNSASAQTILIKESTHGTRLDYPANLCVEVRQDGGRILAENPPSNCWSSYWAWSDLFEPTKDDEVVIPAGGNLERTVDLLKVLSGCPSLPKGLRSGTYDVTVRLGDLTSNPLRVTVAAPRGQQPNNRLNPPVGSVTTLAEGARIAPVPPTG